MKTLFLILKSQYYWEIFNKTKFIEYRERKKFWDKKFNCFDYTHVLFQLGYSKKNRILVPIEKFSVSNDFYEIHLDLNNIKIIDHLKTFDLSDPIYS